MKRITVVVSGRIQNVGYRAEVSTIARTFGLTGFVQNLEDGRIKIIAEGEDDNLDRFLDAIRIGTTLIDVVESVEVEYADATGEYADFYDLVGGGGKTDYMMDKAAEYLKKMIEVMNAGFEALKAESTKSIDQISTLRTKFGEDISTMRRELVGEVEEQILTLRQERLLLFEKELLSDMHENFERYDSALQKTLENFPYEKSVFIMMPFEENDIRLKTLTDTIKETLEEHGLCGWRADDPGRTRMDDVWGNIVVNMLSCKYGIAVFVDKKVLDKYNDEQITVFNANIALEVGFMKSRGLNILLLKDKRLEKLPTDIISKLYKEFDFNDPEGGVKKAITEWIEDYQLDEMHK